MDYIGRNAGSSIKTPDAVESLERTNPANRRCARPATPRTAATAPEKRRSAAQHQKPTRDAGTVGQHPQRQEQVGTPLHFVDYHEAGETLQREHRFGQACHVPRGFQVEHRDRTAAGGSDLSCQGCLAYLEISSVIEEFSGRTTSAPIPRQEHQPQLRRVGSGARASLGIRAQAEVAEVPRALASWQATLVA